LVVFVVGVFVRTTTGPPVVVVTVFDVSTQNAMSELLAQKELLIGWSFSTGCGEDKEGSCAAISTPK